MQVSEFATGVGLWVSFVFFLPDSFFLAAVFIFYRQVEFSRVWAVREVVVRQGRVGGIDRKRAWADPGGLGVLCV